MMSIRQLLVPLLYLIALTKIQLSSCLCIRPLQHQQSLTSFHSRAHGYDQNQRRTQLLSRKSNNDSPGKTNRSKTDSPKNSIATTPLSPDVSLLLDPGLWISDFLAVILASQLIGLLDIVNSEEFIRNGGWFQPIPAVPSTLGDLVQRISYLSIIWTFASASVIFFAKTTSKMSTRNDSSTAAKENSSDRTDTSIILKANLQTLVAFGALQLVATGIISGLGDTNGFVNNDAFLVDGKSVIPWLDVLRNCYYVGLSTSGLRFLYGRYFLLS